MKLAILLAALAASPAYADLYRWIDRETGSVKYSSYPPPWFGDPAREMHAPAVEVIRYAPAAPAQPPKPAASEPLLAVLEAQWKALTQYFSALPPSPDFARAGSGLQQQLQAYEAVRAELDRIDPAGAARRRELEAGIFETIRKGLQAQFSIKPPAQ